ncbi:MAG TPA: UPF0182 family protein, partial [Armatimonadetes bacterium]|nr:UPF0182 family protein [Armatimonadota bacterium]
IPMDHSLLYVEPLYLRAEQSEIPELKRVIVASLERVVMATTLDSALRQLVMAMRRTVGERVKRPTKPAEKRPAGEVTAPEIVTLQMLVDELAKQFENLNQSARQGKWAEFGKRMKDVQRLIQRLKEQVGTK